MPDFDRLIVGARLPDADALTDVAVAGGEIVAIGPSLEGSARERIDARGLVALPGGIDAHVHFNEPGPVRDRRALPPARRRWPPAA
jgi:dihydropyrimidinase